MVQSELVRTLKSRKGIAAMVLIFALPLIDFIQHIYFDIIQFGDFEAYHLNHPVYTAFLSGSSMGHFTQIVLFWILPLYFLMLYSDSCIEDEKIGYLKCLTSRVGRKEYYKTKFKIAVILPATLMFASLTINLILCVIFFHGGSMFGGLEDFYQTMDGWFIFGHDYPYVYYLFYVCTSCLLCSLSSVLGLCCSLIFKNHFKAYPAAFIIWFLLILVPYGISNTAQPYTEYGIKYCFSGLGILALVVFSLVAIAYFMRIKKDEI